MIEIKKFTVNEMNDVVDFELRLRKEEDFWGWEINEEYIENVKKTFEDPKFNNAITFLAYKDGKVVGRIDSSLICSHFDGSINAYLDWICVIKSSRHLGIAQALITELRTMLRKEYNVTNLIALMASNDEAQRFYRALKNADIHDEAIWIKC